MSIEKIEDFASFRETPYKDKIQPEAYALSRMAEEILQEVEEITEAESEHYAEKRERELVTDEQLLDALDTASYQIIVLATLICDSSVEPIETSKFQWLPIFKHGYWKPSKSV